MLFITYNIIKIVKYRKNNFRYFSKQIYDKFKPPWNVLFFGTDEFSLASLKALYSEYRKRNVVQKLEVVTSIKNKINPVRQFAEQEKLHVHGWPLRETSDSFHIGVVVSFGHLIPENIINTFPLGMLNVHASLLPRWRGAAPIVYAIANGDRTTGVTIMQIKPHKFDVGEIITQQPFDIPEDITMPVLYNKLADLGAHTLVKTLSDLPNNLYGAKPQPQVGVTLAPRVKSNMAVVRWESMSAKEIYNLGRALTSMYPLLCKWHDIPVKLYDIKICDKCSVNYNVPGFVIYDKSDGLIKVHCIDGNWLSIEKIGVHNKRLMSATDFNNGYVTKQQENDRIFR